MPQYWVLLMRMPVPEDLRIPGWDTDKFVYKRVEAKRLYYYDTNDELYDESVDSDSSSEADSDVIELYGTIMMHTNIIKLLLMTKLPKIIGES